MAKLGLTKIPEVERLSERVIRILGCNPGKFTLQGTNTYLIGKGPERILLDAAEGVPRWRELLKDVLSSEKASVSDILITHKHGDHTGGISDVLKMFPKASVHKFEPSDTDSPEHSGFKYKSLLDGQNFNGLETTLKIVYCPGHTDDHVGVLLEEEDAFFTGDCVLGEGTSVFDDLAKYMASLTMLEKTFTGRAYPGHGPVIEDGPGRIREYISHRRQREEDILGALRRLPRKTGNRDGCTGMELVLEIYTDVPESLHLAALRGVLMVLEKLQGDGVVRYNEETERYSIVPESDQRKGVL